MSRRGNRRPLHRRNRHNPRAHGHITGNLKYLIYRGCSCQPGSRSANPLSEKLRGPSSVKCTNTEKPISVRPMARFSSRLKRRRMLSFNSTAAASPSRPMGGVCSIGRLCSTADVAMITDQDRAAHWDCLIIARIGSDKGYATFLSGGARAAAGQESGATVHTPGRRLARAPGLQ